MGGRIRNRSALIGGCMTLYGYALGLLALVALYLTADLYRMRRDCARKVRLVNEKLAEAEEFREDAAYLYGKARDVYADAAARWSSLVTLEGRIH